MADKVRKRRGGKKLARSVRKKAKYDRYRNRIGKPNGPGKPGNKAGKNHKIVGE